MDTIQPDCLDAAHIASFALPAHTLFYFFNAYRSARGDREYGKKDKRDPKQRNKNDRHFWDDYPEWSAGYDAGYASLKEERDPRPSYDAYVRCVIEARVSK